MSHRIDFLRMWLVNLKNYRGCLVFVRDRYEVTMSHISQKPYPVSETISRVFVYTIFKDFVWPASNPYGWAISWSLAIRLCPSIIESSILYVSQKSISTLWTLFNFFHTYFWLSQIISSHHRQYFSRISSGSVTFSHLSDIPQGTYMYFCPSVSW